MNTTDVLAELTRSGALMTGHFLLASGRHSGQYVEKFTLLRQPLITSRICEGFTLDAQQRKAELIVGPTTGGILLAFEVARQTGLPAAYAERKTDGSSGRDIRRGTVIEPGTRIYVVDDILTTGGSIQETLEALQPYDAVVIGIGVLVDRSGSTVQFGNIPLQALATLDIDTWNPSDCPLCLAGLPLVKPGTTK